MGRLPAAIQSLGWLRNLFLQGNSLSGHIPGELFSTHTLHTVRLDHNNFAGRVPTSVSAADLSVEFLSLSHNQLTGVIPSISSPSLTTLHLEHNLLTGSIPTTLMSSSLQYLYLQENQLSIGNSFCDVKDLQYVNISCEISVGQMQSCESTLVQQKDTGQCSAPSGLYISLDVSIRLICIKCVVVYFIRWWWKFDYNLCTNCCPYCCTNCYPNNRCSFYCFVFDYRELFLGMSNIHRSFEPRTIYSYASIFQQHR